MNKKGFTLVELLVVVAILGVLAAVGIVSFGGYLGSAKENASRANQLIAFKFIQTSIMKCSMGSELIIKRSFDTNTSILRYSSNLCPLVDSKNAQELMQAFHNHFNAPAVCNPYGLKHSSGTCQEAFASGGQLGNPDRLGETQLFGLENGKLVIQTKISNDEILYDELDLNNL